MNKRLSAFLRLALASLFLGLCVAEANAEYVIKKDLGGSLEESRDKFVAVRDSGERVIIDGVCASSCTFVLSLIPRNRICVTEKASFGFHAARSPVTQQISVRSTDFMFSTYPPDIQKWVQANHALNSLEIKTLRGAELEAMVKPCEPTIYSTTSSGTTGQASR